MFVHLRPALVLLGLFTVLTGLAYPLAITGIASGLLPALAGGSLLKRGDTIVGSSFIGQSFTSARYFHGRPSATTGPDPQDESKTVDVPYNAGNSSGSNLGPTSQKMIDRITADAAALKADGATGLLPADAVTTSGSGLDPHISPAFAKLQIARVAKARGISQDRLAALVASSTEGRLLGIIGEPRVNVLRLNLALDALPAS